MNSFDIDEKSFFEDARLSKLSKLSGVPYMVADDKAASKEREPRFILWSLFSLR